MSVDLDDMGLDDLDFGFDDFDQQEEPNLNDRDPINSLKVAALDTVRDTETYINSGRIIASNALPEGYSEFADGVGSVVDFGGDVVDVAKKKLEPARKTIRDTIIKNKERAKFILPESFIEDLEREKSYEERDAEKDQASLDQDTIALAMANIFQKEQQLESQNALDDAVKEGKRLEYQREVDSSTLQQGDASLAMLNRLVSFNESVNKGYMQKSLELEFRQYFLQRDLFAHSKAYFKDSLPLLKVIMKNSALPDVVKRKISEEYAQMTQERLLGNINDSLSNRLSGYFGQFKENIVNKVSDLAGSISDGITMAGDMLNNDMFEDMDQQQKDELYASMAIGQVADGVSAEVGKKLAKVLEKNPNVASAGLELLYLKNNAPYLFEDLMNNGDESEIGQKILELKEDLGNRTEFIRDGVADIKNSLGNTFGNIGNKAKDMAMSAMPESMKARFGEEAKAEKEAATKEAEAAAKATKDRFADLPDEEEEEDTTEDAWYIKFLKEFAPTLGNNDLQINNTLLEDGYKSASFDIATRTSIVDKIPSLLTEAVRQLTIANEGSDENAMVFSDVTGRLATRTESGDAVKDMLTNSLQSDSKNARVDRILKMLDPDGTLGDEDKVQLERTLLSMASGFEETGGMFTYDNLIKNLDGDTKDRVSGLVNSIGSDGDIVEASRIKDFMNREYGYLRDGFDSAQRSVNQLKMAGSTEELMASGLFKVDPKDPTKLVLDREGYLDTVVSNRQKKETEEPSEVAAKEAKAVKAKEVKPASKTAEKVVAPEPVEEPAVVEITPEDDIVQMAESNSEAIPEKESRFGSLKDKFKEKFDKAEASTRDVVGEINLKGKEYKDTFTEAVNNSETIKAASKMIEESPIYTELKAKVEASDSINALKDKAKDINSFDDVKKYVNDENVLQKIREKIGVDIELEEIAVKLQDPYFYKELRDEMQIPKNMDEAKKALSDLTESIGLPKSVDEAKSSAKKKLEEVNLEELKKQMPDIDIEGMKESAKKKLDEVNVDEIKSSIADTVSESGLGKLRDDIVESDRYQSFMEQSSKTKVSVEEQMDEILANFKRMSIMDKMDNESATPEQAAAVANVEAELIFDAVMEQGDATIAAIKEVTVTLQELMGDKESVDPVHLKQDRLDISLESIFDDINGERAIPVYMPDMDIGMDGTELKLQFLGEELTSFKMQSAESSINTHALLTGILENLQQTEVASTDTPARVGIIGRVGQFTKDFGTGAGNFFQRYYTGLGNFFRSAGAGAGDLASGTLGGLGSFFRGRGKSSSDEENDEEEKQGMLDRAINFATAPFKAALDIQDKIFSEALPNAFRVTKGALKSLNTKVEDVYLGDEDSPRLLASILKRGGYRDAETGDVIYSHRDIKGDVTDPKGNVLLSMQEISEHGITNREGKELSKGRLRDLAGTMGNLTGAAIRSSYELGKETLGATKDATVGLASALSKKAGIDFSFLKGKSPDEGKVDGETDTIGLIYKHMVMRWPLTKEKMDAMESEDTKSVEDLLQEQIDLAEEDGKKDPFDKDGDGFRDGSWQARRAKEKKAKEETEKAVTPKEKKEEEKDSLLMTILMGVGGALTSLTSGLGALLGIGAGSKAIDAAGDFMDGGYGPDMDRNEKNKKGPNRKGGTGKKGLVRRALGAGARGLMTAGKWGLKAAGTLGRFAFGAGGALLRGAGAVAAGVGGVLGAKVIAVATAAYYGYKGIKYLGMNSDAEPLEEVRFMQYGFKPNQGGVNRSLRYLEEAVLSDVEFEGERLVYSKPNREDLLSMLAEEFEFEQSNAEHIKNALNWFNGKFLPVLLHHTAVLNKLDSWVDVNDVDDEIEDEDIVPYLNKINVDKMADRNIYEVKGQAFPGLDILASKSDVTNAIDALLKEHDPEYEKKAEEKKSKKSDAEKAADAGAKKVEESDKKPEKGERPDGKKMLSTLPKNIGNMPSFDELMKSGKGIDKMVATTQQDIMDKALNKPAPNLAATYNLGNTKELVNGAVSKTDPLGNKIIDMSLATDTVIDKDGEVIDKGYDPQYKHYVTTSDADGNLTIYSNMTAADLREIEVGKKVKKGKGFDGSTPAVGSLAQSSELARHLEDKVMAKAKLPMVNREVTLDGLVSEKVKPVGYNGVATEAPKDLSEDIAKIKAQPKRRAKVLKAPAKQEPNVLETELQTTRMMTGEYNSRSIAQRDKMIELLMEIRDCVKEPSIIQNTVTAQPQAEPARRPKQGQTAPPVSFSRPSQFS